MQRPKFDSENISGGTVLVSFVRPNYVFMTDLNLVFTSFWGASRFQFRCFIVQVYILL